MKRLLLIAMMMLPTMLLAEWAPAKTNRMVNDYAGLLSRNEVAELEQRLEAFSDTTSNQIVVITTTTLDGEDIKSVGQRIGQAWGVGGKDYNNGVVILILCSEEEGNEAAIMTGYGLEGALPDLFCKRILDDRMVPSFRDGDYYGGIDAALDVILPVAAGEYSFAQYKKSERTEDIIGVIIFLVLIIIVVVILVRNSKGSSGNAGNHTGGSGPIFMSGPTSFGSFGGGHSSGGFGGFGGFGGGSFGGGGASSKW